MPATPGSGPTDSERAFVARLPYVAEHPKSLAVYCSDGRFTEAVEELFRHLGQDRLDTLTLPGGPGLFDSSTGGLFVSRDLLKSALFLIEAHRVERIVLIAHEGCGFYRQRFPWQPAKIRERQVADLKTAASTFRTPGRSLRIDCFLASIASGHVEFSRVG